MLPKGRTVLLVVVSEFHELIRAGACDRLLLIDHCLWREEFLDDCCEELGVVLEER